MTHYVWNVLASLSHVLNALTGGNCRYSFSARTGAAVSKGKRWARVAAVVVDALLFSRNHCVERAREEGLV